MAEVEGIKVRERKPKENVNIKCVSVLDEVVDSKHNQFDRANRNLEF